MLCTEGRYHSGNRKTEKQNQHNGQHSETHRKDREHMITIIIEGYKEPISHLLSVVVYSQGEVAVGRPFM